FSLEFPVSLVNADERCAAQTNSACRSLSKLTIDELRRSPSQISFKRHYIVRSTSENKTSITLDSGNASQAFRLLEIRTVTARVVSTWNTGEAASQVERPGMIRADKNPSVSGALTTHSRASMHASVREHVNAHVVASRDNDGLRAEMGGL